MNLDKLTYKTIVLQIKAITLQLKYFNIKLLLIKEIIKILLNLKKPIVIMKFLVYSKIVIFIYDNGGFINGYQSGY